MSTRPLNQELTIAKGILSLEAIASLDPYYGVFDSQADAFASVPVSARKVGKPLAIFRDSTKRTIIPYTWATNKVQGWVLQNASGETGTYIGAIGSVTVTTDVVTVTTPISVYFDYVEYHLDEWADLPFTPVSGGNIKVLVVYALPDTDVLHLAEGPEGLETVEPVLPDGALFIRRGIATSSGAAFDPEVDLVGYKKKIEDNWKRVPYAAGTNIVLEMTDEKQNFYMTGGAGTGTTRIVGIKLPAEGTRDFNFTVFNAGAATITVEVSSTAGLIKGFSAGTTTTLIPPNRGNTFKYDSTGNIIDIVKPADGKNIMNSSNTTTGSWTQTIAFGHTMTFATANNPLYITGLADASADASYNMFITVNSAGRLVKTTGKTNFLQIPSIISKNDKNTWLAAMNGETSFSGTSVIIAVPPVVQRSETAQNIMIKGLGLNLVTNFDATPENNRSYVGIWHDVNGDGIQQSDEPDVPAVNYSRVGDNQTILAQLLVNSTVPLGNYKLKVKNAGIPAIGDAYISVVDNIEPITGFMTYVKQLGDAGSSTTFTNGLGTIQLVSDGSIKALGTDDAVTDIIACGYTSELNGEDDWMFVVTVSDLRNYNGNIAGVWNNCIWFGLVADEDGTLLSLGNLLYQQPMLNMLSYDPPLIDFRGGTILNTNYNYLTGSVKFTYIKKGNTLTVLAEYTQATLAKTAIYNGYIDESKNYRFKVLKNNSRANNNTQTIYIEQPKKLS